MKNALIRSTLEHASCGHRFAGGAMRVMVTHHQHFVWVVHVVCSKP